MCVCVCVCVCVCARVCACMCRRVPVLLWQGPVITDNGNVILDVKFDATQVSCDNVYRPSGKRRAIALARLRSPYFLLGRAFRRTP